MNEALRQLEKRVDPVVPPEAAAAQIGGLVVVEATIRANGTVGEVRVLAGERAVHQAAIDAVRQWTFKPFLRNGKPSPVLAILDIAFSDPKRDEAKRRYQEAVQAEVECERVLAARERTAIAACEELVRVTDASRPDEPLVRSRARVLHVRALAESGQVKAALGVLRSALDIRLIASGPADADVASLYAIEGALLRRDGDLLRADEAYTRAVQTFEAAIEKLPSFRENYEARLREVLQLQSELRQSLGLKAAAEALDRKALALTDAPVRPPGPPPMPMTWRTINGVACWCPQDRTVPDQDVAAALKALPASTRPWLANGSGFRPASGPASSSSFSESSLWIYGDATVSTPGFQTGPVLVLSWGDPRKPGSRGWSAHPVAESWLRLDPQSAKTPVAIDDIHWPVRLSWSVGKGPITDDDAAALVRHVRDLGAKTARPGDFDRDVQPLPIRRVLHVGGQRFSVELADMAAQRGQRVEIEKAATGWRVTSVGVDRMFPMR